MRNNDEIIDLIKKICNDKDISLSELARRVDIGKSTMSRYFNKTRQFPLNKVSDFAKALNVNEEYILDISPLDTYLIDTIYTQLNLSRRGKVVDFAKLQLEEQEKLSSLPNALSIKELQEEYAAQGKSLQVVTATERLAAGIGYKYQDDNETFDVYTDRDDLPYYDIASIVTGDSMQPKYNDGDVVLIQQGYDNIQGAVYAVDYDGKSFLKKVFIEGDRIRLASINKKYNDIYIDLPIEQGIYLNILGRVVDSFTPIEV